MGGSLLGCRADLMNSESKLCPPKNCLLHIDARFVSRFWAELCRFDQLAMLERVMHWTGPGMAFHFTSVEFPKTFLAAMLSTAEDAATAQISKLNARSSKYMDSWSKSARAWLMLRTGLLSNSCRQCSLCCATLFSLACLLTLPFPYSD